MLITHYSIKLRKRKYVKRAKASGYTLHKKWKFFFIYKKFNQQIWKKVDGYYCYKNRARWGIKSSTAETTWELIIHKAAGKIL